MMSDAIPAWANFFVAEAGAAAALAGLLFVAISINLTRILEFPQLPARAIEALISLVSVLVVSSFALVPEQSARAYGLEIGVTGLIVWLVQTLGLLRMWKGSHPQAKSPLRVVANQLPPLPFMVAGFLVHQQQVSGLYWTVPGTLLSFTAGIFGAWILLVEIQR
jgi:hypothetical protein